MRLLALLFSLAFTLALGACAQQESDEARSARESGGTLPWNRPEKWEGGGAIGSQLNQFNQ